MSRLYVLVLWLFFMLACGKQLRRDDLAGSRWSPHAGSFWVSRPFLRCRIDLTPSFVGYGSNPPRNSPMPLAGMLFVLVLLFPPPELVLA